MRKYVPSDYMVDAITNAIDERDGEYVHVEDLPRWIPVSERLPDVGEYVLACWVRRKDGMATAVRRDLNGKTAWSAADQWNEIDPPIAWMPLPEPPEVSG